MKALVTGGAGFIGSHLCERLVEAGHEVVVLDDFSSGRPENLAALADRVNVLNASVLDLADHERALAGVERIYHLAALISGRDSLFDPEAYVRVNLVGLSRLLDAARRIGRPRIVFASSSTVYGSTGDPLKRESDVPAPLSMYALTKLAGEHTLSLYGELDGFDWVALRLFNVYGPRQSPDHPYANVTCKFAHAAAVGAGVKRYGDGGQSRDFVYVDDVVDAILRVSESARERVYNVGTGRAASINDLLATIESIAGRALPIEQHPAWPNDIRQIRADIERLGGELGWRPQVSLEEGLARTVAWFRAKSP